MFGIKTKIIDRLKTRLIWSSQPVLGLKFLESRLLLMLIKKELKSELKFTNLQTPIAKQSNPIATRIIKSLANFMPNNLGNWSIKTPSILSAKVEFELIKWLKDKYHAPKNIVGHFGSGSTEGNIYATWLGRKYLMNKLALEDTKKIVLIKSCLAHYSINKAADLVGVKLIEISIEKNDFNIDEIELLDNIKNLYQQGTRGFMIPLTLGYTVGGTDDNYQKIDKIITRFKKEHSNCEFFLWIDAAFSGISRVFLTNNFQPFKAKSVQLITSDFHKFLAVPYPASIMLYRKNLLSLVAKEIPYIDQMDTTLLGSRPGLNVLATWMSLLLLGENGIKKALQKSLKEKNNYLKKIALANLPIKIINNELSNQSCLIGAGQLTNRILESKFGLKPIKYPLLLKKKKTKITIYKLYFLPNF